jgi:RNA polymerase-interacting CarD/CdnL/TRCF family regulator
MFRTGRTVFYPRCGLCLVAGVTLRPTGSEGTLFYHLTMLDSHGELFVPVDKARTLGLRALVTRAEVVTLLETLGRTADSSIHWKQLRNDNRRRLASGSAFDLAEALTSLAVLSSTRALSLGDSRMLVRAKVLLIDEISRVMGTTRCSVEKQIDRSLETQKHV